MGFITIDGPLDSRRSQLKKIVMINMNIDALLKEIDKIKDKTTVSDSAEKSIILQDDVSNSLEKEAEQAALHAKVIKLHPEMEAEETVLTPPKDASLHRADPQWLEDLIQSADSLSRKAKALRLPPLLLTEVYEPSLSQELKAEIRTTILTWMKKAEPSEVIAFIEKVTTHNVQPKEYMSL